jgi:NAD-reducing hydrogenase large subunit
MRNVIGVAQKHPELAVQGVLMRKFGQEVIKATAGKKMHGTGAIPGGMNKNLSIAERDELLKDIDQMVEWSRRAVKIAKDYTVENLALGQGVRQLRLEPPQHRPRGRRPGPLHGVLRAKDKDGNKIFDQGRLPEVPRLTSPRRCGRGRT